MKITQIINIYLNSYINNAQTTSTNELHLLLIENKEIRIANKLFTINAWIEAIEDVGDLFIIQADHKILLGKKVYSKAMIINEQRTTISQEQLWDLGLG